MNTTWWMSIVLSGLGGLGLMIAKMLPRKIAASRRGLDKKEIAVMRRATRLSAGEQISRNLVDGVLYAPQLWILQVLQPFGYFKHRAAAKKLVPRDPTEQNRAQGVIFSFHELRLTRTELIRGYEENAQHIALRGLTATVTTGQTVQIRIEGPETNFVYRNAFDAEFNVKPALQFAALLNYEASLQGAPPKKVQERPPPT
jgi:hypothetical protein